MFVSSIFTHSISLSLSMTYCIQRLCAIGEHCLLQICLFLIPLLFLIAKLNHHIIHFALHNPTHTLSIELGHSQTKEERETDLIFGQHLLSEALHCLLFGVDLSQRKVSLALHLFHSELCRRLLFVCFALRQFAGRQLCVFGVEFGGQRLALRLQLLDGGAVCLEFVAQLLIRGQRFAFLLFQRLRGSDETE